MLILGLLLLAGAGAFTGLLIADNLAGGPEYRATVLGQELATMDALGIFLAGLALALVFCLGCAMVALSRVRTRRRRALTATEGGTAPLAPEPAYAERRAPVERAADPSAADPAPAREARDHDARGIPSATESRHRLRHLFGH
ncbi:hypothetical protein ACWEQL_27440 [Kitasatospora sp. NPDC004240]